MRILILNWRDIKNPKGGGAEILTHEMAKRWVKSGHEVTQFSARFPGSRSEEVKDGVKIIRRGSADIRSLGISVHLAAFAWYKQQPKGSFDVIIDEIHGVPFFTPWYAKEKKFALICEVADKLWDVAFSFPINRIGSIVENSYFHLYNNMPFFTISHSTKVELLKRGIKERNITVLPMGLSLPKRIPRYVKEKNPTLIFVARLTKAKGILDAILALAQLKKTIPGIRLWIIGQGEQTIEQHMRHLVKKLSLDDCVKYFGFVDQNKKFELMTRAHILIAPSFKEGWGLTVPEAGFVGTPAVAYNVEGLRDVIQHNKTGILTELSPECMAKEVNKLLHNRVIYNRLQMGAKELSKTKSWDKTADLALSILKS